MSNYLSTRGFHYLSAPTVTSAENLVVSQSGSAIKSDGPFVGTLRQSDVLAQLQRLQQKIVGNR
jgi:hypothetical protein